MPITRRNSSKDEEDEDTEEETVAGEVEELFACSLVPKGSGEGAHRTERGVPIGKSVVNLTSTTFADWKCNTHR